jgi:hypothetical protein
LEPNLVFPHFFHKIILHSSDPIKQSGDAIDRFLGCLSLSEVEQHGMHDGLWRNFFSKNIVCGGKWYSREERYADLADVIVRILGKIWYWSNGL